MSPELETLDQLLAGDLSLEIVSQLYPSAEEFRRGILGLLRCGDISLLTIEDATVPASRWRELFSEGKLMRELHHLKLHLTMQGANRIK